MSDDNKDKAPEAAKNADDELSQLLDSALEDFKKEPPSQEKPAEVAGEEKVEEIANVEEWNEEFIRQAAAQFESSLANLLGPGTEGDAPTPEQIQAKFQQMAEAAQQVIENPTVTEGSTDFAATISQTIQGLSVGNDPLQNPFNEDDIMNLFGAQGGQNAFLPFMQGMMQSLLSKDVLYPSLKDILDKFPDWLRDNREKLSAEDIQRYENQIKLMQEVCTELEQEQESDSVEVKRDRFDKILASMQKLQDYGQPPTELVGDVGPPLPMEFQSDPNQCLLM